MNLNDCLLLELIELAAPRCDPFLGLRGTLIRHRPSSGKGDQYPDPKSQFLKGEDSYILLTLTENPAKMVVEIKGLDGTVLDRKVFGE